MPDMEIKHSTKVILQELGKSLASIFKVDDNNDFSDLLRRIDEAQSCYETDLDRSNQRVLRCLEKSGGGDQQPELGYTQFPGLDGTWSPRPAPRA